MLQPLSPMIALVLPHNQRCKVFIQWGNWKKKKTHRSKPFKSFLKECIVWRNTQLPLSGCLKITVKNSQQKYLQAHDEEKYPCDYLKKKKKGCPRREGEERKRGGRRGRRREGMWREGEGREFSLPQHMEPLNIKYSISFIPLLLQDPSMFSKWIWMDKRHRNAIK